MDRRHIQRFLPENFRFAASRPDGVTAAMLAAMEALHEPDEAIIANIDGYVSPNRAPGDFVMLQASWLGLDRYFDWSGGRPGTGKPHFAAGVNQLRLLMAEAAELLRRRGMHDTLLRFLELATGVRGFAIAEGKADGTARPFHFTLNAPAEALPLARLVSRIVEGERPAHATYDINFAKQPPAQDPRA